MTRMAEPGRQQDDLEDDEQRFEDEGRRSIFSALWFRAILVVVVLGVVAAVAVPYVLELANQPSPKPTVAARPETAPPPAPIVPPSPSAETTPPQAPAAAPAPAMEKPPAEKPPIAEKAPAPEKAAPAPSRKADPRTAAVANESTPRPKATSPAPTVQGQGAYFIQVGAFKSQDSAKRLATRLRELKYNVEETAATGSAKTSASAPAPSSSSASDKYDVYVMGGTAGDINAKLGPKGLTSEPSAGGVVVKPSLPLRDAVALSKDLAVDGLKVQVRRSSSGAASSSSAASAAPSSDGLYRVRVGPYDDRATATSTLRELQQHGYTPFIARAGQ